MRSLGRPAARFIRIRSSSPATRTVKPPSGTFPGKAALYDALFRLGIRTFHAGLEQV